MLVVFVTVALKVTEPPAATVAVAGAIEIPTTGAAVTVTVAVAVFVVSATLFATTWQVPAAPGAV